MGKTSMWVLLTDFKVEHVVRTDRFAAVFEELLNVHWDGQPLKLAATLAGELVDPLGRIWRYKCANRLSVYCLTLLVTNLIL